MKTRGAIVRGVDQPWEVVELSSITVVPGTPLAPGQPVPAPPPPTALLPIPVPKDQC